MSRAARMNLLLHRSTKQPLYTSTLSRADKTVAALQAHLKESLKTNQLLLKAIKEWTYRTGLPGIPSFSTLQDDTQSVSHIPPMSEIPTHDTHTFPAQDETYQKAARHQYTSERPDKIEPAGGLDSPGDVDVVQERLSKRALKSDTQSPEQKSINQEMKLLRTDLAQLDDRIKEKIEQMRQVSNPVERELYENDLSLKWTFEVRKEVSHEKINLCHHRT